jgi:hypothetical protein
MPSLIFNLKKIKGSNSLEPALKHNLRKIAAEKGGYSGIDSTRSHLNQVLIGGDDIDELKLTVAVFAYFEHWHSDFVGQD